MMYLWWILDPFLDLVMYYTVMGVILNRGGEGYVYDLLIGIMVMRWFSSSVTASGASLMVNAGLINSVKIPKFVFPAIQTVLNTLKFLPIFLLFAAWMCFWGGAYDFQDALVFPLLFVQFLFILGISFLAAGMTPFFPDMTILLPKLMLLLFWGSGVFFRAEDIISSEYLHMFYLNTLASFISLYRGVILHQVFDVNMFMYVCGVSLGVFCLGYFFIWLNDRKFSEQVMGK
jgi:ABC-type polysaccharide/polyol phosphate export permease